MKAAWGSAEPRENNPVKGFPVPQSGLGPSILRLLSHVGVGMLYTGELFLTSREFSSRFPAPALSPEKPRNQGGLRINLSSQ